MSRDAGLLTLFALVLVDALGVPAPGDSALLVAGALVSEGHFALPAVVVVASAAAIIGDTIVYWVGRSGGRPLLQRDGRFAEHRRRGLAQAEGFYARYGVLAVFVGRFIPGVRGVGALAAGTSGMPWAPFAIVNALACVTWTTVAVAAGYALGPAAVIAVLCGAVLVAGVAWAVRRRRARTAHA